VPRITVFEHSTEIARLLELSLGEYGYEVRVVVEADDPVEVVKGRPPNLVILDLLPYGEEALEALDDLRSDEATSTIPVIATTTSQETADAARASYNVVAALVKPFDLPALEEAVQRALG